jgi:hypothetical protein
MCGGQGDGKLNHVTADGAISLRVLNASSELEFRFSRSVAGRDTDDAPAIGIRRSIRTVAHLSIIQNG